MSRIKQSIESLFTRIGHGVFRHRIKVLLAMAVLIGGLASQIPRLSIDTSFEGMLRADDPDRVTLNAFRDRFKGSELIVLMIKSPDLFDEGFLKKLYAMHRDIEKNVPWLIEVNSLINARRIKASGDTLIVDDLFRGWPEHPVDLSGIRSYVESTPFFKDHLVSSDGHYTAVILETQAILSDPSGNGGDVMKGFEPEKPGGSDEKRYFSEKENTQVVTAIESIVKKYQGKDFAIAVTGSPMVVEAYNRCTQEDIGRLIVLSTLAMIVFLALLFRRVSGVVFPFVIVESGLLSTLGMMSLGHVSISIMTIILPSFLIAVGVADSIHILSIFFQRFEATGDKRESIAFAMGHSALPVIMTSVTTAAGLLSFAWSELSAIGDLGIYAAAGVMLCLVYTVILLPALLAVTPIRRKPNALKSEASLMSGVLAAFSRLSTGHPWKIAVTGFLICGLSALCIYNVRLCHDTLNYFPDDMTVKKDLIDVDRHMKGNLALDLVVDTGRENGVCDPQFLNTLDSALKLLPGVSVQTLSAGKIFSMIDILKETNKALHNDDPAFDIIPDTRELVSQELLLFSNSGSDDLERFVDSRYATLRILVKIPWVDLVVTDRYITTVKQRIQEAIGSGYTVTATGLTSLMARTLPIALTSMIKSYVIAFVVITLMMIFLIGDIKTGLVSMVPNLLPILAAIGIMGVAHIPMDLSALMIGSIAIGLVVDDTIHFMYQFRRKFDACGDVGEAVRGTMMETGRAMIITSLVLASNFLVYTLATLNNLTVFGAITGMVIILALLADLVITPALLVILFRPHQKVEEVEVSLKKALTITLPNAKETGMQG